MVVWYWFAGGLFVFWQWFGRGFLADCGAEEVICLWFWPWFGRDFVMVSLWVCSWAWSWENTTRMECMAKQEKKEKEIREKKS